MLKTLFPFGVAAALLLAGAAEARDQIRIVGSSTVFPFAAAVAERFGRATTYKTPVVESTGSGSGIKLFCAGLGVGTPDIANASRRMMKSEFDRCAKNGVTNITEIKIGFDGIVIANSKKARRLELSLRHVYLALGKLVPAGNRDGGKLIPNPNRTWKDVDPALPAVRIRVLGPPPTSGTRDAFNELAMEGGCRTFGSLKAMAKTDKQKFHAVCRGIREDGAYVEAGENDNLIVQKLEADPDAVGVFGFSFLEQNTDRLQGSIVNGKAPTFENISAQTYPVSRSLFFYVKNAHVKAIRGIRDYIAEFASDRASGEDGYLADKGLIPLPPEERRRYREAGEKLAPLAL